MRSVAGLLAALVATVTHADSVTFHPDAKKFLCPTTPETPLRLDSVSLDKGSKIIKHILLEPHYASRELCTLSRVNDEFTSNRIYIPIARAYDENPFWNKSAGRYVATTQVLCGAATADGPTGSGYRAGETLCQISLPPLELENDGYYLTTFAVPDHLKDERAIVANFLEKVTFGPTTEEITKLTTQYNQQGPMALAHWLKQSLAKPISSHRAEFRKRLHPRTVESYIYGIPGPRPCEKDARFRRFAFTYMDVEISRGSSSTADNTGHPYTKMKIETIQINGVNHWKVKFGDQLRTVLSTPLKYYNDNNRYFDPSGAVTDLPDGEYTLCNAEEVVGSKIGDTTFEDIGTYSFQILVGAKCMSSYTNRGGQDDKGDGSIDEQLIKVGSSLVRSYDSAQCNLKCGDSTFVRYVKGGNPEVSIPSGFDKTTISYLDLTKLNNPATQLVNLNADKFHDSSWRITANLATSFVSDPPSCKDENGATIPDAAGLAYNDYFSTGRGKYNLDAPIFAMMPNNKWALHDYRSKFQANTLESPLADAGGAEMKRARRAVNGVRYGDGTPYVDLVTRCSNVEANIFNEAFCKISYDENACETTPAKNIGMSNPSVSYEDASKYIPAYAGRAVVVCGSENEIAPDQSDDDHYAVSNRKLNSHRISYSNQIRTVWMEQALYAEDQPCQKLAWQLSKIFAYSNGHGEDETYLNTYDWAFVASCDSTFAEVVKKMTHNVEMAEQLTFKSNKAVAYEWHRSGNINYPDENYARENLQLHQIGLPKLMEDGSPKLDKFGKHIPNYTQQNIFAASKIFTGLGRSYRRGNYNDLDRTTASFLDPLIQKNIQEKDWFPKIGFDESYIGDQYPLCADLPSKHFLKKGAKFVALGGKNLGRYHNDPNDYYLNDEVQKLQLDFEESSGYGRSPLFDKLCRPKSSFQNPTSSLIQGSGQAQYDSSIGAPKCAGMASRCDSNTLLEGRFSSEPNYSNTINSNTIDDCSDGNAEPMREGDSNVDIKESVKSIVVEAVKGSVMRGGSLVSIKATVIAYNLNDKVDFYYAHDAANPDWKFITTVSPTVGEQTVTLPRPDMSKITFRLPICNADHCDVAVRVALRSSRKLITTSNTWTSDIQSISGDGINKPSKVCAKDPYDDTDDLAFQVLPSAKPQDMCDFQGTITLDENLSSYCTSGSLYDECHVDTIRVVEVLPGVYYEYVRLPCVNMPFIQESHTTKVFAGSNMTTATVMCADKRLASATSTCCGGYSNRHPDQSVTANNHWADILSEYRGERLTYDGNSIRCKRWDRAECDPNVGPTRIGPSTMWRGQCTNHMSCADTNSGGNGRWLESMVYHWTSLGCKIKIKVDVEGMIAVVHVPFEPNLSETNPSQVLPLVGYNSTVSFFSVHWDKSNVVMGKLAYPHHSDNACDGGEIRGDFCFCGTTLLEEPVFYSLPMKEEILDKLHIGAFDPTVFEFDADPYILHEASADVKMYTRATSPPYYSSETIFRVVNDYNGEPLYLKNMRSVVSVCNGSFKFRNAPTFYNVANPDIVSANQEMEAYLQAVINHDSAPPFTCISLMKTFGFSNPSPSHVSSCSQAFKSGTYLFSNPENTGLFSGETLSFGSGKRSDMHAILAAIVLSPESYSPSIILDPASGGVKDPFEKLLHVMRSLKLKRTPHHRRSDGLLQGNIVSIIGSGCYGPKDQFSFYSPDFIPPGNHLEAGLTSPAGELTTLNGIVGVSNALYALVRFGLSACSGGIGIRWNRALYDPCGNYLDGLYANTAAYLSYSPSKDQSAFDIVDQLSLLLTSSRLSPENRAIIVNQFSLSYNANGMMEALQVATVLTMSAPEFHTFNTVSMSGAARAATPSKQKDESVPYKAIVHVNLFGGMDSMNMLTPHPDGCLSLYDEYKYYRGVKNSLTGTSNPTFVKIDATTSDQPCTFFGVNSKLNNLANIYNEGDGVFFASIGHLQKPVNRYNFQRETTAQLFSHFSMREEMFKVDAFDEMNGSGILGRMADVFSVSMGIGQTGVGSSPTILKGDPSLANPVNVVKTVRGLDTFYQGRDICSEAASQLNAQCTRGSSNSWRLTLLEKMKELNKKTKATSSLQAEFWSQSFIDAMAESDSFRSLLDGACQNQDGSSIACSGSNSCPIGCKCQSSKCAGGGASIPDNELGQQLDMVFRLITLNEARGVNRDFFAVELGGFDTHFEMVDGLSTKFDIINSALHGFRLDLKAALLSDGSTLWDKVTVVMSSEFGRSVSPNNGGGTDHGWAGNSYVMGGRVKGGRILGEHPNTYNPAGTYNTGRGVWIPTTPWESQWYAIVQWAGITDQAAIDYVLPNSQNFGCNLYAEVDLFEGGTASLSGCGGCVIQLRQSFYVSEARVLIPDEQTAFCGVVVANVAPVEIRCFIQDQILSPLEVPVGNAKYEIVVDYEINFDPTVINCAEVVTKNIDTDTFRAEAASILILMDEVIIQQAVVELAPSMSPSTSMKPSEADMPSGQPSLSIRPSMAIYIAPYYGHKFVGEGKCMGILGGNVQFQTSTYNYLEFKNSLFVAAVRCPSACAPYRAYNQYRGFEFKSEICRCLFDSGTDLNQVLNDNGGSPHTTVETNKARGIVIGSDGSSDLACYEVRLPEAPEVVEKFEYIGFGECWDVSKATYDYFAVTSSEAATSAVKCGEACSLSNYPLSNGFFLKKGTDCHCLFNDGDTVTGITITDNGVGTGQIVSSNYVEGHCYKALPAPTNFPTKMPTPKPTPRPTRKPTSNPSANPSAFPSLMPSFNPSSEPSSAPSSFPSRQPSLKPSADPSSQPSSNPSTSVKPSSDPSSSPSKSSEPSNTPSPSNSTQPSSDPSSSPSKSSEPSNTPNLSPSTSTQPSSDPSSTPSKSSEPSNTPSPSTSTQPSSDPSSSPSKSSKPSTEPSLSPSTSTQPSSDPSSTPSKSSEPSNTPSLSPSTSTQPSSDPSTSPSKSSEPSNTPSLSPSTSTQPSSDPSTSPSKSSEPSSGPSLSPSISVHPSLEPSWNPSKSFIPTSQPSSLPSLMPSTSSEPSSSSQPILSPSTPAQPSSEPSTNPIAFRSFMPSSAPSPPMCPADPATPSIPCICGSCDLDVCSANSCYNGEEPFCGTNTGCTYIKDATPPVEISLAFVDGSNPPFKCMQVMVHKHCIQNVTLTGAGLFTINKEKCTKGGDMLTKVRLLQYGDANCNFQGFFTETGTNIDTSCATPVYVGKRYEVTFGKTSSAELFITAFCNAAKGRTKVCLGSYPPECGDFNVAKPTKDNTNKNTLFQ